MHIYRGRFKNIKKYDAHPSRGRTRATCSGPQPHATADGPGRSKHFFFYPHPSLSLSRSSGVFFPRFLTGKGSQSVRTSRVFFLHATTVFFLTFRLLFLFSNLPTRFFATKRTARIKCSARLAVDGPVRYNQFIV